MMTLPRMLTILFVLVASGCGTLRLPSTLSAPENAAPYGYHPIDPLPVTVRGAGEITSKRILDSLPDETMRIAIGQVELNGGISFGPAQAGVAGNRYVVVLDYIKFDTKAFGADIKDSAGTRTANLTEGDKPTAVVPVYIGVGLRLSASVTVHEGHVDLGNLFALGAAAQARKISGTMAIQTLGISGEGISPLVPMPSEINASTIQAALVSLGAIKAKMYDAQTKVNPRVVGVYNNLGGGEETISGFITSFLQKPQFLDVKP